MEEQDIKRKVQLLYGIKPREDWVLLNRNKLFHEEERKENNLQIGRFWGMIAGVGGGLGRYLEKPAFVMPALALLVAGGAIWQGVAESLPGDRLYSVKSTAEQVPLYFSLKEEKSIREFALAQQRLADLKVIAEKNKVKNLPSAIQEFEANANKISEGFLEIVENQPQNALQASRQVVELQKEKSEVEKILGTKIGQDKEEEIESAVKKLVEYELAYLESRSLTKEQEKLLESAKLSAGEEDYATALETIWELSQKP